MPTFLHLLVAYGLAFGLQNDKAPFGFSEKLRKVSLFDRMLACTYCTGFHCGWIVWLLAVVVEGKFPVPPSLTVLGVLGIPVSMVVWGFCAAAACYCIDAAVRWLEANTPAEPE